MNQLNRPDLPFQVLPLFQERIWGRSSLLPFFGESHPVRIGEAWFTFRENLTKAGARLGELIAAQPEILGAAADPLHPDLCPLLVKLLFTSERLSVQVHPDDAYASHHHQCLGKTEAWYVVSAEVGGEVAVGFKERISPERLEATARSGEIEQLLDWRPVKADDIILVPAGTVHAIGAGVCICEVQQNSDITYRLYDYGRPRELHLDHGAKVSHLGPYEWRPEIKVLAPGRKELAVCDYFRIEKLELAAAAKVEADLDYYLLLLCLKGAGTIAGQPFAAGETWFVPAGGNEFEITGSESEWILTYTAKEPVSILT